MREVGAHAVEGARQRANLLGAVFAHRRRLLASAEPDGRLREAAQRPVDAIDEEPAAQHSEREQSADPADPAPWKWTLQACARDHQPIAGLVDGEAYPQRAAVAGYQH